jgi:hypothetical protein
MNTSFWKIAASWFVLGLIVGLLVGMAIGWRWDQRVMQLTGNNASTTTTTITGISNTLTIASSTDSGAAITVNDQPAGRAAMIAKAVITQSAWISVRQILASGGMGKVLGAVRRDPGTYDNVVVDLLGTTVPDAHYAIVLYASGTSKAFSTKTVIPGADGQSVSAQFKATTPVSPSGK